MKVAAAAAAAAADDDDDVAARHHRTTVVRLMDDAGIAVDVFPSRFILLTVTSTRTITSLYSIEHRPPKYTPESQERKISI